MVNIADEIAYKFHDLDDALRARVIACADLEEVALWKQAKEALPQDLQGRPENIISKVMERMIGDLVRTTDENLRRHRIQSVNQVYGHSDYLVAFSPALRQSVDELGAFLHDRFYKSEPVRRYNEQGRKVVTFLFHALLKDPSLIPEDYRQRLKDEPSHVLAKDYLAGMTDDYALELYRLLEK